MPFPKPVTILELMGTESGSSLYFQSSALPTELPGQGIRKRVLNSRAQPESSPERRFRDAGAIIQGSGRADPEKCDVEVLENDLKADAGGLEKMDITIAMRRFKGTQYWQPFLKTTLCSTPLRLPVFLQ